MISWGKKSGLLSYYPDAMLIGYDFPFVSAEQKNRFNMRGYASAYFLPDTCIFWSILKRTIARKSIGKMFWIVLSMFTKKMESHIWMCICASYKE